MDLPYLEKSHNGNIRFCKSATEYIQLADYQGTVIQSDKSAAVP